MGTALSPARLALLAHLVPLWGCPLPESPGRECLNYFPSPTWLGVEWLKELQKGVPRALRAASQPVLPAQPLPGWIRGVLGCSLFAVGDSSLPALSLLLSLVSLLSPEPPGPALITPSTWSLSLQDKAELRSR